MRFASLGSGSRGNALLVESGATRILVDCGFGPRELAARLARLGVAPQDIDAVVVTHEHSDHVSGVASCAARFEFAIHSSYGTFMAAGLAGRVDVSMFDGHGAFAVKDMEIQPFPVPHDAREPTQFVISDGRFRLGVLTDAGSVTPHMIAMLDGCDALVLECNHDTDMLQNGDYPKSLKQRIAGRLGHLDNEAAADLLARIDRRRLQHLVAAHLSEQNNRPQLAQAALARSLGCKPSDVPVADQQNGFDWRRIC
jgi:phosphoribosyl 1,2-cyclic phosphodiesterase